MIKFSDFKWWAFFILPPWFVLTVAGRLLCFLVCKLCELLWEFGNRALGFGKSFKEANDALRYKTAKLLLKDGVQDRIKDEIKKSALNAHF